MIILDKSSLTGEEYGYNWRDIKIFTGLEVE